MSSDVLVRLLVLAPLLTKISELFEDLILGLG